MKILPSDDHLTIPPPDRLTAIDNAVKPILSIPQVMPAGQLARWHSHNRGQLIYPHSGQCRIYTEDQLWTGSPHRAIWIPPGVMHTVQAIDELQTHNIYVDTRVFSDFDHSSHLVLIDPLLHNLLTLSSEIAGQQTRYSKTRHHMLHLLADLIRTRHDDVTPSLPLSDDQRLRIIMDALIENPADNRPLERWADVACGSSRTIARLFIKETGMTFQQWRQHRRVIAAIGWLESGYSVSRTASDLGYVSQSSFTAMFRRITGCCPARFRRAAANKNNPT